MYVCIQNLSRAWIFFRIFVCMSVCMSVRSKKERANFGWRRKKRELSRIVCCSAIIIIIIIIVINNNNILLNTIINKAYCRLRFAWYPLIPYYIIIEVILYRILHIYIGYLYLIIPYIWYSII